MKTITGQDAGRKVIFISGELELNDDAGKSFRARGAISPDGKTMWIRADHNTLTATEIAKHEEYHGKVKLNRLLLPETKARILKGHTDAELNDMIDAYIDLYGYTDVDADYIFEEICADAYAGIDVFADYLTDYKGAERFSNEVNETAAENRTTARNAVNNSDNKNTATEGGGIKYSLEQKSIKEQVYDNLPTLNKMKAVAEINSNGYKGMSKGQIRAKIINGLRSTGFRVDRKNFGTIVFDEKRLNTGLDYESTPAEMAAFSAIPKVLKQGIEINSRDEHKGRGYGTFTFAAPVTFNGSTGIVAVVVKQTSKNFYKAHRVLTPDGKMFVLPEIEDAESTTGGGVAENGSLATPIDSASDNSIRSKNEKVNTSQGPVKQDISSAKTKFSMEVPAEETDARYLKAVNAGDMDTARKMVDDAAKKAGYTNRLYHGTPNGTFNVFKDWQYFTQNKEYADVYQSQGASSNGYKTRAENPKTYGVFAKADMPFDTRKAKEKHIFMTQFYQQWGNGAPLSEKGLPDWTDGDDLTEFFDEKGYSYDEILLDEGATGGYGEDVKSRGISYAVKKSAQIESADPVTYDNEGNVIPLSERFNSDNDDIRYSREVPEEIDSALREYIKKYGEIPAGENPFRQIHIPKKTSDTEKVSQTVRTILEGRATPDELVPDISELAAKGIFSYEAYSDKKAISDAEAEIKKQNWDDALHGWLKDAEKGIISKKNTAIGWALYNNAANSGNTKTALNILDLIIGQQRNAAQAVQATRIFKQLDPQTQLYGAVNQVDRLQRDINKKYGKNAPELKINEELANDLINAKTQEERDAAYKDIYRDIGRQMPSRFMDKWNAWRYLAMLGNPRTHVRNIMGNAFFAPVVGMKNVVATGIETAVDKATSGGIDRTKSLTISQKLYRAAIADYANISEIALGSGKYNDADNVNKYIQDGRVIFTGKMFKWLEWARKKNGMALDFEDVWFSKPHYAAAMASYCKANGITAAQIASGKGLERARAYAITEAQKATYRDTNALSQAISGMGRYTGDNIVRKGINLAFEGILPFRKTPANILARGLQYSPLGLAKSIAYDLSQVKKGNMSAAEAIDGISAGLTGSGLLALGVWLAAEGLLRGSGGSDDDKKKYDKLQGHQDYSLELPDGTSITLDWLAPECLPLFVGVNIYERTQGKVEKVNMATLLTATKDISDPLLEMSCLQSLNDVFDAAGYAFSNDVNALTSALASAATSYVTQAVPTILGQLERTTQKERVTTYTSKNSFLTSDVQYALGKASSRIPGWDYGQIPYIDAWGRTENSGGVAGRALNNMLNPSYTSNIKGSQMESELERLYDATGDASVLPDRAAKHFTVNGERKDLTAQEYVKYATEKGTASREILTAITASSGYIAATDDEKAKMISEAYDYANQVAKAAVSEFEPESWVTKAQTTAKKTGVSTATYLALRAQTSGMESLKDAQGDSIENSKGLLVMEKVYEVGGLTADQRKDLLADLGVGKTIINYSQKAVEKRLTAMKKRAAK